MENIKAQIAFDLIPILRHLSEGGIFSIYPSGPSVQMTVECYHETFPEDLTPVPNPDSDFPSRWTTTIDGVEFFALEASDGLGCK